MKKTLYVLLTLVLVAGNVFAAPTFSGRFGVRYTYTYDGGAVVSADRNYMTLTDSSDVWSLSFQGIGFDYGAYDAYATINLDKVLAAADVKLPVTVALNVGTTDQSAGYAYIDPTGADKWYLPLATESDRPFSVDVGLMDGKVTVTAAAGIETGKRSFGFNVHANVTEGVDVQAAYSQEVNALSASAGIDVAALAGLDFGLKAGGYTEIYLDDMSKNLYVGGLSASVDAASAYAEYRNVAGVNEVYAGVGYKLSDIFRVGAGLSCSDLSDFANNWDANGYLRADLAGVRAYLSVGAKNAYTYLQFTF